MREVSDITENAALAFSEVAGAVETGTRRASTLVLSGPRRTLGQAIDLGAAKAMTGAATVSPSEIGLREGAAAAPEAGPAQKSDPSAVEACISRLVVLDGRDLHTDVERGRVLVTLEASCEDGAAFAEVVKSRARMTDRQARNLMSVSTRFGGDVDRWAAIGVTSTHLRHLVKKADDFIEECYADFVENGVPTTADFALKVKSATQEKAAAPAAVRRERLAALKAAARQAAEDNLAAFLAQLQGLAQVLSAGLKLGRDGEVRIRKAELAKAAALPARTACRIMEGVLTHLVPQGGFDGLHYFDRVTVALPELQALRVVLLQLTSAETWPKHIAAEWITDTVLPMVLWTIGADCEVAPPIEAILDEAARSSVLSRAMPEAVVAERLARAKARGTPPIGMAVADNDDDAEADEHDDVEPAAA